ncbi:hypothetical protein NliqN6_5156 [Naganishia liquefaciens]|uniref:Protein ARV n=1 Tax=Naganishia liquefaciens TaxID=104408 RepID=A0A8H3TX82_9TREE|nr:hypothetical protein NliqN6_5156 [Naganishia liquefaciens]
MPICVHCNGLVPYVYTVYSSKDNVRLAVCEQCHLFADPLIEHPLVLLLIDLILLKPRVYRHLVFNRGSQPFNAGKKNPLTRGSMAGEGSNVKEKLDNSEFEDEQTRVTAMNHDRHEITWRSIFLLAAITMSIEILVLYSTMSSSLSDNVRLFPLSATQKRLWASSSVIVVLSTAAQHLTSTAISAGFLKLSNARWLLTSSDTLKVLTSTKATKGSSAQNGENGQGFQDDATDPVTANGKIYDGRGIYFTLPMISLTLFFSSLLPCLLHVCLFIWSANIDGKEDSSGNTNVWTNNGPPNSKLVHLMGMQLSRLGTYLHPTLTQDFRHSWHSMTSILKREGIDEMWIVVRLLAGMSSGFGLRVVLPGPPWHASTAVLGGWLIKTAIQTGIHAYLLA